DPADVLLTLLGSPNLASRRPVFEQYDCLVGSRTARRPAEADAAVLALPGGGALAVSIDGNGRRVASDPRRGAAEAVYECAANLAGSEVARLQGEALADGLGEWDADDVVEAIAAVRDAVAAGRVASAHDVAEGGFAVALAECCLAGAIGARIDAGPSDDALRH